MAIVKRQLRFVNVNFLQLHIQSRAKTNISPPQLFPMCEMSTTHQERTAADLRQNCIHRVTLQQVETINENIRLFKLEIPNGVRIKFRPGQWLDVQIPGVPQVGGFTLTSTPREAEAHSGKTPQNGYLELAVQKAPQNTPAAWLWRPENEILGSRVEVRVGGSFVWPPADLPVSEIKKLVLVAGGVGVNPLMSMISHIAKSPSQSQPTVQFLYASRCPTSGNLSSILFHSRLRSIFDLSLASQSRYQLYLTGATVSKLNQSASDGADPVAVVHHRRINHDDLVDALGPVSEREAVVAYVCGPPAMTDEFVTLIRDAPGMDATRVFCEKWW